MGTFTVATGFGMLAVGLVLIMVIAVVAWFVINAQKRHLQDQQNRSEIEKQIERIKEVRQG